MASPNTSESMVLSSSPPKPAPRTRMRFFIKSLNQMVVILSDPQPVAVGIIETKLGQAVKSNAQVRHGQAVPAHFPVILHYVLGIQVENRLAGCVRILVDRLIHHQTTPAIGEHGPTPIIILSLHA